VAAGPVSRILSVLRRDGHSSGPRITARLKRPTRRLWRTEPARTRPKPGSLPIWSCSVWGLPCPPHYRVGGALLPHLFTLTWALRPGRYVFCGTFRRTGLNRPSRTLSGTLLCGVRTFLPSLLKNSDERPSGPAAYKFDYSAVRRGGGHSLSDRALPDVAGCPPLRRTRTLHWPVAAKLGAEATTLSYEYWRGH
jgi:hypothetical protein